MEQLIQLSMVLYMSPKMSILSFGVQGEASDLGHRRAGEVPHHHVDLLPRNSRRHRRLRRHVGRIVRQRQAVR